MGGCTCGDSGKWRADGSRSRRGRWHHGLDRIGGCAPCCNAATPTCVWHCEERACFFSLTNCPSSHSEILYSLFPLWHSRQFVGTEPAAQSHSICWHRKSLQCIQF